MQIFWQVGVIICKDMSQGRECKNLRRYARFIEDARKILHCYELVFFIFKYSNSHLLQHFKYF